MSRSLRGSSLELALLVTVIIVGGAVGVAYGEAVNGATSGNGLPIVALCAYGGAALFVGVGLVNRTLRSSMFVVPLGSPIAWIIVALLGYIVGFVALPVIVAWRIREFVASATVAR